MRVKWHSLAKDWILFTVNLPTETNESSLIVFLILAVKCLFCGFRDTLPDHFPDVVGGVGIFQNLISKEFFFSNFKLLPA